jgi:hypothetical protein
MATEHDPRALDAPIQPGGVPRHASAKERRARGLKPFLSDLRAEVQNQLSRADTQAAPRDAHEHTTQVAHPAVGPQGQAPHGQAQAQQPDDGVVLASAALASADHAGAEAAAARTESAAARADAAAARTEAAAARSDAATAQTTAERAGAQLQATRAEIEAAHQEFETLRAELAAARERTRRHLLISWTGTGVAAAVAVTALVLAF